MESKEQLLFTEEQQKRNRLRPMVALSMLTICLALPFSLGFTGYSIAQSKSDWYDHINKPSWLLPHWIVKIIWTVLYTHLGLCSYAILYKHCKYGTDITAATIAYVATLILHSLWSPLFFAKEWFTAAAGDLLLLWLGAVACVYFFWRISKWAGILLIPYPIWLLFELAINIFIAVNNKSGGNVTDILPIPTN